MRSWKDEVVALLAAKTPRLDSALRKIARRGGEAVLIDGTLIPTRRRTGADNRKSYSGRHKRKGLHFLALTDERAPDPDLRSPPRTHPRHHRRPPRPHRRPPQSRRPDRHKVISAARALVEHGLAYLKNRRVPTKLRTDPARATNLLRALTNLEVNR